jgi:hypothetical protein
MPRSRSATPRRPGPRLLGFYGWRAWLYGGHDRTRLVVTGTSAGEAVALAVSGVALTAALWLFLDRATDSTVPFRRPASAGRFGGSGSPQI